MSGDALPPLRVGLVGCGRVGLHLIERSAVGWPFQVVAASEMLSEKPVARLSRAEVCADLLGPGEPSYSESPRSRVAHNSRIAAAKDSPAPVPNAARLPQRS